MIATNTQFYKMKVGFVTGKVCSFCHNGAP